jgi:hypothetical protein
MPPRRDRDGEGDAPAPAPPAKPSPPARRRVSCTGVLAPDAGLAHGVRSRGGCRRPRFTTTPTRAPLLQHRTSPLQAAASPAPPARQRPSRGLIVDGAPRASSVGASSSRGGTAVAKRVSPRAAPTPAPAPAAALGAPTWSGVDDAPVQARYDFVLTGYRYNYSAWHGLTGLFQWHFETVNIWTHLLGLAWFVAQVPRTMALMEASHSPKVDKLYYYGFLGAAMFQMATSTVYHTWRNMSPAVETALLRLDVVGVAGMIVGSYAVGLLNGFWCDPWLHGA